MLRNMWSELRKYLVGSCATVVVAAGVGRAQAPDLPPAPVDALKAQFEANQKELDELKAMIHAGQVTPAGAEAADPAGSKSVDEVQVKKILDSYLKEKDDKVRHESVAME